MSENAGTFDSLRGTVSQMSLERSNEPVRTKRLGSEQSSGTRKPAFSTAETAQVTPSGRISTPSVTFVVDQESGKSFIQVVDRDSGEILRQIPPEEARRLSAALKEMVGNMVDKIA